MTSRWFLSSSWEIVFPELDIFEFDIFENCDYDLSFTKYPCAPDKVIKLTLDEKSFCKLQIDRLKDKEFCIIVQNGRNFFLIHDFIMKASKYEFKNSSSKEKYIELFGNYMLIEDVKPNYAKFSKI